MKRRFRNALKQTVIIVFVIMGFAACEKDAKEFGEQIMHPDDSIAAKYDSSFRFNTYVEKSDSFQTLYSSIETPYTQQNTSVLLGDYLSEPFGRIKAGFLAQLVNSDSISFDSLRAVGADLYLRIGELYGPKGNAEVNVYKLNRSLEYDVPVYSNTNPLEYYNPEDEVSISTEIQGDSLMKVTLTKDFAEFLTSAPDSIMGDVSDFVDFFPGIYAEMETGEKGFINRIKLPNDTTRLELVYEKIGESEPDTFEYNMPSSGLRANLYEHHFDEATYSGPNVNDFLTNDPSENDSLLFINSLGGTRARLVIPEEVRKTFSKDTIFMARAEIELKPDPVYNTRFFPDAVNMFTYINDTSYVSLSGSQFFDGEYDVGKNVFSCNITKYLQDYIDGYIENNNLYIEIKNRRYDPGELVVAGSKNESPIKLKIKYYKP
jgi:hypothetical protein